MTAVAVAEGEDEADLLDWGWRFGDWSGEICVDFDLES